MEIYFQHIPKTGGSTIRNYIKNKHEDFLYMCHRSIKNIPNNKNDYYFTFIRNPIDRFLSAWNYLIGGGNIDMDKFKGEYLYYKWKGNINKFIQEEDFNMLSRNIIHFRPISYFISKENIKKYNFIGRHENFENDFNKLLDELNIDKPKEIPKNNISKKHKYYYTRDFLHYKSIDRLKEIYYYDFLNFNYEI